MKSRFNSSYLAFTFGCTLFLSLGFSLANYIHIPMEGVKDLFLNFIHFLIVALGTFCLCYLLAINKYLFAILFPIVTALCAIIAYFIYSLNLTFTTSILDAALHNDLRTSIDVISLPLVLTIFFSLFIAISAVFYRIKHIRFRFKWVEILAILILFEIVYTINLKRNNSICQRLPFSVCYVGKTYLSQMKSLKQHRLSIGTDAHTSTDSLAIVLVIGEATRSDHLQLNGYWRNTNPRLSHIPVISFPHIYSEWTHTNTSLPHFLTRSDSINHNPAFCEKSFISIFNLCGFTTSWIANQEPAASYLPFVKEAQTIFYVNPANSVYIFNKKWLDSDMLSYLEKQLKSATPKKLIVMHTIGSHWWYNDHFTDCFVSFKPILKTKIIPPKDKAEIINSYDNTVVYTDYFLSKVIEKLEPISACMVYLSDHGESLGENGKWLHAQDNEAEKNPACLIWCSEKYIEKHLQMYQNIIRNKDKKWPTEFLFSSILSLAEITTGIKNNKLDITAF